MSPKKIEFLFSGMIVLFLMWIVWEPRTWPAPARFYPWSLGFLVLGIALIQFAIATHAALAEGKSHAGESATASPDSAVNEDRMRQRIVTIIVWIVAFCFGIWLVGFKIGSFFLTIAFMKITAKESWPTSMNMALGTYLFFWLVFDIALKVPLGNGLIGDYFALD